MAIVAGRADGRFAAWFAAIVVLVYGLILLPPLIRAQGDASVFVIAGDLFVDPAALPAPIVVRPHSPGFDGQFYYRIALDPFALVPTAHGITLDAPSLRMMRVFYPLLAWGVSLGRPGLVADAMLGLNLAGLGLIAWLAADLSRTLGRPRWCCLAMLAWPGFVISLMRDTTEICSAALVLLAVRAAIARSPLALFAAGAAACLTRETGILALAGLGLLYGCRCLAGLVRRRTDPTELRLLAASAAALLPAVAWQLVLHHAFGQTASAAEGAANLGWPLAGMLGALSDALHGRPAYHGMGHILGPTLHLVVAATIAGLGAWTLFVLAELPRAVRDPGCRVVAAAWAPLAAMTLVMTGPWIEPLSYFRAFTESWLLGSLLIGGIALPRGLVALGGVGLGCCWLLCAVTMH